MPGPSFGSSTSHRQLHHLVADQLRAAILDGRYRPGEWLRQERLAQELGVSQMPVREALKELAAEGLVEHVPYRGVQVVEFFVEDVEDLYAQRCFLEGRAARAAAQNITREELDILNELHRQMKNHLAPDQLSEYRRLNRQFHAVIFAASRRKYLTRTLTQLWSAFPNMLLTNFATTADQPLTERDEADIYEHSEIVRALEDHDRERAEALMVQHIQNTKTMLISSLDSKV